MMNSADMANELSGMELLINRELQRDVQAGLYLTIIGAVAQVLARCMV